MSAIQLFTRVPHISSLASLAVLLSACGSGITDPNPLTNMSSTSEFSTSEDGDGDGDGDADTESDTTAPDLPATSTDTTGDGSCGDGHVDPGEECDNGGANSNDAECTTFCKQAVCGDGYIWSGEEECDDGNDDDSDACPSTCLPATCGDGHVWEGEETCDGDASCLSDCKRAPSCKVLLADDDSREDGSYAILPAGSGEELEVYCDMTTDNGGWTRVMLAQAGDLSTCNSHNRWHTALTVVDAWDNGGQVMSKYFDASSSSEEGSPVSIVKFVPGPYGTLSNMFDFTGGPANYEYGADDAFALTVIDGTNYSNVVWWNGGSTPQTKRNYCIGSGPDHQACLWDGSSSGHCGHIYHDGEWRTNNAAQELFVRDP